MPFYFVKAIMVRLTVIGFKKMNLSFQKRLEEILEIPVVLQDERLTTKSAQDMLIQGNVSRKDRKKVVDSVAATIILQSSLLTLTR